MKSPFSEPPNRYQALVNIVADLCWAQGWLTIHDQQKNLFDHHHCEMVYQDKAWIKLCSCGKAVGQTRGDYLVHLIEFLEETQGEAVRNRLLGDGGRQEGSTRSDGQDVGPSVHGERGPGDLPQPYREYPWTCLYESPWSGVDAAPESADPQGQEGLFARVRRFVAKFKIGIPKTGWGQFVFFFLTEWFSYFLIVANTRAFTQANYLWTAATDFLFAASNFIVIRLIAGNPEARNIWSGMGYTLGGTCGSLISIWVTVHVYGQ